MRYKCFETDDPEFYISKVCFILNNDMSEMEPVFAEEKFNKSGQLDKVREDSLRDLLQKQQWVEYSKEKEMATHPSILAWRIPGTEEPGRLCVHWVTKSQTWLKQRSMDTLILLQFWKSGSLLQRVDSFLLKKKRERERERDSKLFKVWLKLVILYFNCTSLSLGSGETLKFNVASVTHYKLNQNDRRLAEVSQLYKIPQMLVTCTPSVELVYK